MKLFIPGPLPTLNTMIAAMNANRHKGNALKKQWTEVVAWEAKRQKIAPATKSVTLHFTWHEKHNRRDKDNIAAAKKYVLDGLVLAGVLADDGWKHVEGFTDRFTVSTTPGVLVEIMEGNR